MATLKCHYVQIKRGGIPFFKVLRVTRHRVGAADKEIKRIKGKLSVKCKGLVQWKNGHSIKPITYRHRNQCMYSKFDVSEKPRISEPIQFPFLNIKVANQI